MFNTISLSLYSQRTRIELSDFRRRGIVLFILLFSHMYGKQKKTWNIVMQYFNVYELGYSNMPYYTADHFKHFQCLFSLNLYS